MTIKIHSWLIFAVLIGAGILIFACIRGCNQGQQAVAESIQWKQENTKLVHDTARLAQERDSLKRIYQDSLEFVNGQWLLAKNQTVATRYQLDSADKRITELRARYQAVIPNKDTSVTTVSNDYIANCADCFAELSNGQEKVKTYIAQIDNLNQSYQSKINLQQSRINQLDKQNTQLAGTLHDCIDASQRAEKKLSPHGQLFFSWNVLWLPLPKMAGVGFMYENNRKVQFGLRGMFGQYGNGVETEVNMPLSLKRK